ncbi:MAG TPA: polyprenol monophosphomannose synthase [Pirellulales bacterium]|nr:polyprenol monophosphomannose synthase [Pirellulales bacterium]
MISADKTLVTIATYNEIENLPQLLGELFSYAPQVDVCIVDDGSPDGTGRWCDEQAHSDPRIHCIHRSGKLGLGSAILAGMQYALDHGYDYVVNMDADFSHDPRYVPDLLAAMNRDGEGEIDVMIGSRYVPGGQIEGWPLKRHFMSRAINLYSRALLGLRVKDCSGGFRCYRTSRLRQLDFGQLTSSGYSFQEEMLWRLKKLGCRMGEYPITFVDRVRGLSKIDGREALSALSIIARLGARNLVHR